MTDIIYIEDPSFENEENDLINLELYFLFNNSSIYIKINKYSIIDNIKYFIEDHYGLYDVSIIFKDIEIKNGTFISNNIKENSKITIVSNMKTGKLNNNYTFNQFIVIDKKIVDEFEEICKKNLEKIISDEEIVEDDKTNKKSKLKRNYYMSPEIEYTDRHNLNREELEMLGKKFKIAMEEEIKKQEQKDKENDKLKKKINDLKQKIRMSKNKKLGIKEIPQINKKDTFGGLKKGFLL